MLCRLHLAMPKVQPRGHVWGARPGWLFEELEREIDAMWELLTSHWRPVTSHEEDHDVAASDPNGAFMVTQDMAGFDPQELVVKLSGEKVVLTGKRATRTPEGPFRYEVFRREWDVPESVDRERLSCSISRGGELRIEAPAAEPAARMVPIVINRVAEAVQEEAPSTSADENRAQG